MCRQVKQSMNKSTGTDGIPIRFLKMNMKLSCTIITHIINLSLKTLIVPLGWKKAVVTPLFKAGCREDAGNYRPVSILPAVSKLIERVVHNQLMEYLNRYKIPSEAQFRFRKGHSTTTCILSFLNEVYLNMDAGKYTRVVFLDLKKAFDMVDHSMYGLSDNARNWFLSYLSGRIQMTRVKGTLSGSRDMKCGVPQGSILGPLLFIVYINDLSVYLNECRVSLYADDTALYATSESYIDLMLALRIDMATVTEWLKLNKLTLNVGKTKLMIFGSQRKLNRINEVKLELNGVNIERVETFKYLGITLDQCLTFESHIQYVYNKCCARLGMLRKAQNCL